MSSPFSSFPISYFAGGNPWETSDYKNSRKTDPKSGMKIHGDSGPTPVARGGSGAKAPPLAARPKFVGVAEGVSPLSF